MERSTELLIAVASLALVALAAFAVYRRRQRHRVRRVEGWVRDYLRARYGELPTRLSINCSDDPLWPVLVAFNAPGSGVRHNLRFTCGATHSTFALLGDKDEIC